jgi:hypothetical protein
MMHKGHTYIPLARVRRASLSSVIARDAAAGQGKGSQNKRNATPASTHFHLRVKHTAIEYANSQLYIANSKKKKSIFSLVLTAELPELSSSSWPNT